MNPGAEIIARQKELYLLRNRIDRLKDIASHRQGEGSQSLEKQIQAAEFQVKMVGARLSKIQQQDPGRRSECTANGNEELN